MAKVYIDRDSIPSFFVWDKQTLDIIDTDNYLVKVDIPDELLLEYTDNIEQFGRIQGRLREYYDETQRTREAIAGSKL
jgi:hypothetical protein